MLTPRQLEVLELLAKGLTNAEIGSVLDISPGTAKVHVSRVIAALDVTNRTEAAVALRDLRPASGGDRVPGFGERPAIAVLPFDNLSDDPEQGHFADGLVEDLTTRLAAWRWFPVIARNSAFALGGGKASLREVSAELGARYLIEGSTRSHGDRLRINVQLIDGQSDAHLFAEKYDRSVGDVFALQDEIVHAIVGVLEPTLLRVEGLRALGTSEASLDSWGCFQRGMAVLYGQASGFADASLAHFDEAIRRDEGFAPAHAGRAMALFAKGISQVGSTHEDPAKAGGLEAALDAASRCFAAAVVAGRRAVALDPLDGFGYLGLGSGLALTGEAAQAIAALERAALLCPSSATACFSLATLLTHTERAEEAVPLLERAIRLSPRDPNLHHFHGSLAGCHLQAGRDREALEHARRSVDVEPESAMSYQPLISACLAQLGQLDEARVEIERVRARWPDWNTGLIRMLAPAPVLARVVEGYRLAGWDLEPES